MAKRKTFFGLIGVGLFILALVLIALSPGILALGSNPVVAVPSTGDHARPLFLVLAGLAAVGLCCIIGAVIAGIHRSKSTGKGTRKAAAHATPVKQRKAMGEHQAASKTRRKAVGKHSQ